MSKKPDALSNGSRTLLPVHGQSRSFSDSIADEESRGRHLEATPRSKPCDLHPSLRNDLYPASMNPLRAPNTMIARPPQLNSGQVTRAASSTSVLGSGDRLRPLTPIHTKSHSGAMFTTSPASSDLGSPGLPAVRSSSHTSLNRFQGPVHCDPRPPTPTAKKGRGGRASSIPPRSPHSRKSSSSRPGTPHPHGKPSVKHLTCFWWKEKGDCRFQEEDCLYAHHDTGLYADPPRQVIPGGKFLVFQRTPVHHHSHCVLEPRRLLTHTNVTEPAMAGRSLDRALKKLHSDHNKSSNSLTSMSSEVVHADTVSRPGSPRSKPPTSPAVFEQLKGIEIAYAAAKSDIAFLRNLVEQNTKEKAVLVTTVDNLQVEARTSKEGNRSLKTENDQLREERDLLRSALSQLQINQRQAPTSTLLGPVGSGSPGLPTIRRTRATNEFDIDEDSLMQSTTESDNQSGQLSAILRNLGRSF